MKKIPRRLHLTEEQMPCQWYNLRADMPAQPDPLRDPMTGRILAARLPRRSEFPSHPLF